MSGLTEDLVEEILARVPTTSLKRLRFTCKKWNTLFSDRRFTKKHFDKAEKEYLDLMFRDVRLSWMSVNLHGLPDNTDPSTIEFKGELSLTNLHYNSDIVYYDEVFHCNGLLLCISKNYNVVWNPCTGQTKWIPTKSANTRYHKYALGYVNKESCRNYKILRFWTHETSELEIFEFNSDSWRVCGSLNPDFELDTGCMSTVKGNTYWIASDNEGECFLISFDFTTERFGPRVCLPFQSNAYVHTMSLYSVREERLSVLFHNEDALKIEIWKTEDIVETNVMSWSNFLRIDHFTLQFLNGVSFVIDEENKSAVVCEDGFRNDGTDCLVAYIIGEDRCREVDLGGDRPCLPIPPYLFSYVPSLVQI